MWIARARPTNITDPDTHKYVLPVSKKIGTKCPVKLTNGVLLR